MSYSSIRIASFEYLKRQLSADNYGVSAHLIIDDTRTYIYIVIGNVPKYFKDIPLGQAEIVSDASRYYSEVDSIVSDFWELRLFGAPVEIFHVYGNGEDFYKYLLDQGKNAEYHSPGQEISQELACSAALSTFNKGNQIELLPQAAHTIEKRIKLKLIYRILRYGAVPVCLAALLFLALIWGGFFFWDQRTKEEYAVLQEKIGRLREIKHQNAVLLKKYDENKNLLEQRSKTAVLLEVLRSKMPDGVWLEQFNYQKGTVESPILYISGFAATNQVLNEFLKELEETTVFKKVNMQVTNTLSAGTAYKRTRGKMPGPVQFFKIEINL